MEEKKRLKPISIDGQRRVPNIHRNDMEASMSQLMGQIVSM